jgi:hypothetical protein
MTNLTFVCIGPTLHEAQIKLPKNIPSYKKLVDNIKYISNSQLQLLFKYFSVQ